MNVHYKPTATFQSRYMEYIVTQRVCCSLDSGAMTYIPFKMSDDKDDDSDFGLALDTRPKTKRPPLYKVMILNDDYTPMEFVVLVLERFFGMTSAQSFELMLTVHKKCLAVVGVYSHEIAETKVAQVMDFAQRHEHPLQCTMEKE
jgi:ATP-dependent Clp protease adaptor protein ClpS